MVRVSMDRMPSSSSIIDPLIQERLEIRDLLSRCSIRKSLLSKVTFVISTTSEPSRKTRSEFDKKSSYSPCSILPTTSIKEPVDKLETQYYLFFKLP